MARIRSVHPSLFTDESWVSCSPLARILYIGLWTDADDQGLFEWKPLQIKMRLLPGDTAHTSELLDELANVNLVKQYEVGGVKYGAIRDFRKYQRPQKPNAIHPITEIVAEYVALPVTDPEPVSDQSTTDPVNPPQMEDGGGRGEETAKANALSVTHAHEKPVGFEDWWALYPGAIAKPKARAAYAVAVAKIGGDDPHRVLLDGLRRSLTNPRWSDPSQTDPNPATWLADERWNDRDCTTPVAANAAPLHEWTGPADVLAAVATVMGEGAIASYLAPAAWDGSSRTIIAARSYAADQLRRTAGSALKAIGVRIATPQAQDRAA